MLSTTLRQQNPPDFLEKADDTEEDTGQALSTGTNREPGLPVCSLDNVAKTTADASDSLSFPILSSWPILSWPILSAIADRQTNRVTWSPVQRRAICAEWLTVGMTISLQAGFSADHLCTIFPRTLMLCGLRFTQASRAAEGRGWRDLLPRQITNGSACWPKISGLTP